MRDAKEIANEINSDKNWWNPELLCELCEAAGMGNEWDAADSDTFEAVVYKAANKLGVKIL